MLNILRITDKIKIYNIIKIVLDTRINYIFNRNESEMNIIFLKNNRDKSIYYRSKIINIINIISYIFKKKNKCTTFSIEHFDREQRSFILFI